MYCRMNVYNGNALVDNGFEAERRCGCNTASYETLYRLTPVAVQASAAIADDTAANNIIVNQNNCGCCRRRRCCCRRCCGC